MTVAGWLQIALVLGAVIAAAWPLGHYMAQVFQGRRTLLSPAVAPVEVVLFRTSGLDPKSQQSWLGYALAMLAFNAAGFLLLYALLRSDMRPVLQVN